MDRQIRDMLRALKLFIPVIIPSWRFFDEIAPSPRIEISLLDHQNEEPKDWQEFRPQPLHMTPTTMIAHLFWNRARNERLYLTSCAERIACGDIPHSEAQIMGRIREDFKGKASHVTFRLRLIHRDENAIVYQSATYSLNEDA